MSNAVFPVLPGLTWNVVRQPEFRTKVQSAVSGREIRLAFMSSPMYTFKMGYEVLRQGGAFNELKTLGGFFLNRLGSFDSFLYTDPTDSSVTAASFGAGNGTTLQFQLVRPYGPAGSAFVEPVENLNGAPAIYKDGVLQTTGYTVGDTGIVTFATAPSAGVQLTWTGSFYYRVRFKQDVAEFNNFMKDLFDLKKMELYGATSNKVGE